MSIVGSQHQDKTVTKIQRSQDFCQKRDVGGLSFLQSMSDITSIDRSREDTAYVHPNEKRSISMLNERSLEMCTESLGAETGSESSEEFSFLAFEATITSRVSAPPLPPQPKPQDEEEEDINLLMQKPKMTSRNNSFPPPIEFIRGSKYNHMVRSLGDDGRLIVQAIKVSSPPPCLVAERGEGRLRLSLTAERSSLCHKHKEEAEAEDGMDEKNNDKVEDKSGNNKLRKLGRRCKENGLDPKPMLTWKQQQFLVATRVL